jgi:ElaB/YqjD/DUF883 family membrane-anchored ribosome-binding protein
MSSSTDIQRDLEQTRSRMSAELDALAYKLDVPSRAKDRLTGAAHKVRSAAPSTGDVKGTARDNPLGVVLGGAAVGVLAGLLLPRTKVEDEKVGPLADRVRDEVVSTGREALQRGKSVARQAGEAAKDAATDAAEKQGEAIKQTAGRRAKKVADSAR